MFFAPSVVVEARNVVRRIVETINIWAVCSTDWRKLVHLQEKLCRNAVGRMAIYA
jgi:hypothetical protein